MYSSTSSLSNTCATGTTIGSDTVCKVNSNNSSSKLAPNVLEANARRNSNTGTGPSVFKPSVLSSPASPSSPPFIVSHSFRPPSMKQTGFSPPIVSSSPILLSSTSASPATAGITASGLSTVSENAANVAPPFVKNVARRTSYAYALNTPSVSASPTTQSVPASANPVPSPLPPAPTRAPPPLPRKSAINTFNVNSIAVPLNPSRRVQAEVDERESCVPANHLQIPPPALSAPPDQGATVTSNGSVSSFHPSPFHRIASVNNTLSSNASSNSVSVSSVPSTSSFRAPQRSMKPLPYPPAESPASATHVAISNGAPSSLSAAALANKRGSSALSSSGLKTANHHSVSVYPSSTTVNIGVFSTSSPGRSTHLNSRAHNDSSTTNFSDSYSTSYTHSVPLNSASSAYSSSPTASRPPALPRSSASNVFSMPPPSRPPPPLPSQSQSQVHSTLPVPSLSSPSLMSTSPSPAFSAFSELDLAARLSSASVSSGCCSTTPPFISPNYDELTSHNHVTNSYSTSSDYVTWKEQYARIQLRNVSIWKEIYHEFIHISEEECVKKLTSSKGKESIDKKGIPPIYRAYVWELLLQAKRDRMDNPNYYYELILQLKAKATKSTKDIEKDVSRTMQSHTQMSTSSAIHMMTRILCAFSFRQPQIGYCQSMSTLVAVLLLHYCNSSTHDEERCFWVFHNLLMDVLPAQYYTPSMLGVRTDTNVLNILVKSKLPRLHHHFTKHSVDLSMCTLSWFMCIYVNVLPMETVMRCWDLLIIYGSGILLSIALSLLHLHESTLIGIVSASDLYKYLSCIGASEYDFDTRLSPLIHGKFHDKTMDVTKLRGFVFEMLEREYVARLKFIQIRK